MIIDLPRHATLAVDGKEASSLTMVKELTDYIEGETSVLTSCMWYLDLTLRY